MGTMMKLPLALWTLAGLTACGVLEERPVKVTSTVSPYYYYAKNLNESSTATPAAKAEAKGDARADRGADATVPPVFKVGQQWTYRRTDLWRKEESERFRQEMVFEEAGRWLVRWTILNSDDATRRGSITGEYLSPENHGFADLRMKGQHEPLRFPLTPGKTWSFEYSLQNNAKRTRITQTATVKGWENVNVPAGNFMALRVEHQGIYNSSDGDYQWSGRIRETYWYAPAARRVVKREYQDTKGDGSTWDQWRDELVEVRL